MNQILVKARNLLPWGCVLFVLTLGICEAASGYALRQIQIACHGGDLIRFDTSLACKNYRRFENRREARKEHRLVKRPYHTWRALRDAGPYDVVVFGDSTAHRAWITLLREAMSVRVANMAAQKGTLWPNGFSHLVKHYAKFNAGHRSIWLYAGTTEQSGRTYTRPYLLRHMIEREREQPYADRQFRRNNGAFNLKSSNLWFYLKAWHGFRQEADSVLVKMIGDEEHLVLRRNWDALKDTSTYTPREYESLKKQFKEAKDIAAQHGSLFAYVAMPSKLQVYDWLVDPIEKLRYRKHTDTIKRITRELEIPFLDIEAELKPLAQDLYERERKLFWLPADAHMNVTGAYATTEIMQGFLADLIPLLTSTRT